MHTKKERHELPGQRYADATVESLIRAFRKKGKSLEPDLASLHKAIKRHYLGTSLTRKQAQARASWDVEQTRREMAADGRGSKP